MKKKVEADHLQETDSEKVEPAQESRFSPGTGSAQTHEAPTEAELMQKLKGLTVTKLIEKLESPAVKSYDIANAVRFLKDAGVSKPAESPPGGDDEEEGKPEAKTAPQLQADLPFGSAEGSPSGGDWSPLGAREELSVPFKKPLPFLCTPETDEERKREK